MQRCLSTLEFEDLLSCQHDWTVDEPLSAHVASCLQCGAEFACRTAVADAPEWSNAARAGLVLNAPEEALLAQLRRPDLHETNGPANGGAAPASDWFRWDSLNARKNEDGAFLRKQPLAEPLPDVPGFELIKKIGRGGMGVVYQARQLASNRVVALKMILAGSQASAEDLGRFYDEADAIGRLRHPHIVQIIEVGQHEGRLFFALEFVQGGTLAEHLRQRTLPPRAAAQLLEALARAMHYAHGRGIIHRDLKPANVLLHGRKAFLEVPEEADRQPTDWDFRRHMPKITDFGLAKMLDHSTGHTSSGDVLGTPSYMAPEQAQGKPYPIGPATDVYSLGAILYEMLTGRPPFQGPSPMDTLFLVHTQEPEPPRRLRKDVPARLEAICLKCLKKSPDDRYTTAEELAEDLHLYLEGQPVQARGPSRLYQEWLWLRNKTGTGVFAVLVLVCAIVAGATMTRLWRESEKRSHQIQTINSTHATAELEVLRLRFDRALAECEAGRHAAGMLEFAILLQEAETRTDAAGLVELLRSNLRAWTLDTPRLQAMMPVTWPSALLPDGTHVVTVDRQLSIRPVVVGESDEPRAFGEISDRARFLTVSRDGTRAACIVGTQLSIWDLTVGKRLWHTTESEGAVIAAAFAPHDERLLIATQDGKLFINNSSVTAGFAVVRSGWPIAEIAWSPSGKEALLRGHNGKVVVATLSPWQERELPCDHSQRAIAWSADGAVAFTGSSAGNVCSWRLGQLQSAIPAHTSMLVGLAASPAGRLLLTASANEAKLWHVHTNTLLAVLPHPAAVRALAFTANGESFATSDDTGTMRIWTVPASWSGSRLAVPTFPMAAPTLSRDGHALLAQHGARSATIWQLQKGLTAELPAPAGPLLLAQLSPDGKSALLGGGEGTRGELIVIDSDSKKIVATMAHNSPVHAAVWSSDGQAVFSASANGAMHTWELPSGTKLWQTPQPAISGQPACLVQCKDRALVAIGGTGLSVRGEARVWNIVKNEPASPVLTHPVPVVDVQFESATVVRTRDADHVVRRWDYATGQMLPQPEIAQNQRLVALAADNRTYLVRTANDTLQLCQADANDSQAIVSPPGAIWKTAVFSEDSSLLVVGYSNGVRLWHIATGRPIGAPLPLANLVAAAFTADARQIMAYSNTNVVIWPLPNLATARDELRFVQRLTGMARETDGACQFLDARAWTALAADD